MEQQTYTRTLVLISIFLLLISSVSIAKIIESNPTLSRTKAHNSNQFNAASMISTPLGPAISWQRHSSTS